MPPQPFDASEFQAALGTDAIGRFLVYRLQTETTMVLARREADEGAPHGTLVLAEEQTAGRGRRGRTFHSPPGENLYFTVVLRLPFEVHARLPIVTPVAVCEAVRDEGLDARIKWPNDIWVADRKLCGMLIDAELGPESGVALAGIGINVNGDPTQNLELASIATSIRLALGQNVSRERLLARICNALERAIQCDAGDLVARYRGMSMILGREIVVHPPAGEAYPATATGIGTAGELLVTRPGGDEHALNAADVTVRPL